MDREDGNYFIKHLATYIRTHEKALANALQLQARRPSRSADGQTSPTHAPATSPSASSALAAAFSLPSLSFTSQNLKPAKLALTPHHLYYLLDRFDALGISVGPMNVRLENIHAETAPGNYVSFLDSAQRARRTKSTDALSIHSVSSVKSVMSGMSSLWNSFGLGSSSASKQEKTKQAINMDLKYIYSAFTKIPCLKLCPDPKARLISGYEEFPFDTAVPLLAFKNVTALEIVDIDIRQFYGWDQVAERVRSLVVKRACIEDPAELLIAIVLDDMDKRRRRSSKNQASPLSWSTPSPGMPLSIDTGSIPGSPGKQGTEEQGTSVGSTGSTLRDRSAVNRPVSRNRDRDSSNSPTRPNSSRSSSTTNNNSNNNNHHSGHHAHKSHRMRRSDSGSSRASSNGTNQYGTTTQSISLMGTLPSNKWRFLRHLSLADNSLTTISFVSLAPLANSLTSLDLSSNLFITVPDALSTLTALRALNLSNNMIESLHSLTRHPLPAITALNLRGNRLKSLAGIERLPSLERLDLRENKLSDPTELARLTVAPNFREVWIYPNPFVRTHNSTYRVTIFNLFRKTPGFTEDITIDAQGPGMMERRQLLERAAEPIPVPVVRPAVTTAPPREIVRETRPAPTTHSRTHSEKGLITTRPTDDLTRARKKGAKRRVVELSKGDGGSEIFTTADRAPTFSPADFQVHRQPTAPAIPTYSTRPQFPASPPSPPTSIRKSHTINIDAETPPTPPAKEITLPTNLTPGEDWTLKGDDYKRRVEHLKNEYGNGWLSALADERWNNNPGGPQSPPNRDAQGSRR
ncbi:hypothetical protein TWF173_001962 [Orbilia oligospora]|nr:hypothetical protein TWF173_001962 [Orbilia oligospora]KAF3308072.1 hypothetical protein TWF173_001962 [Orbilia oligospora]